MAFALTPAGAQVTQGLPGEWLQVQSDGVDVGNANVEVIDIVGDPEVLLATRGVGENAHVITIRVVAPASTGLIGWLNPSDSSSGVAAASNSGARSIEDTPFPTEQVLYMGVVGWTSETVVWDCDYVTTGFTGFPPVFTDLGGGKAKLAWPNIDYPFNRAYDAGLATITATINGTPSTNAIEGGMADGLYGDLVWGPAP